MFALELEERPELIPELLPVDERKIDLTQIPKEFGWLVHLKLKQEKLKKEGRAAIFEFGYMEHGQMVWYDTPKGQPDSEHQSMIPQLPNEIRMLEHKSGKGLVVTQRFESPSRIDPDISTAERIWNLAGSL